MGNLKMNFGGLSRRDFLYLSGIGAAGMMFSGLPAWAQKQEKNQNAAADCARASVGHPLVWMPTRIKILPII
jgi:hypothetical protein